MWTTAKFREALTARGVTTSATIAFTARSGSTWLCDLLCNNGIGNPTEFFQYPYDQNPHFMPGTAGPAADRILDVIAANAVHGIFVSKLAHDHRAHLDQALGRDVSDYTGLDSILPNHRWLFLKRRNAVDQAISQFVAERSQVWHVVNDSDAATVCRPIPYDFFGILANLMILSAGNENWNCYLRSHALPALLVDYEDLVADTRATLMTVIRHITGVSTIREPTVSSRLSRISGVDGAQYDGLRTRFTQDFLKIGQDDDATRFGPSYHKWLDFFSERRWNALD